MRRRLDSKRSAAQRGEAELAAILQRIDGRSYNAYREVKGRFELRDFTLYVDHIQGDPFAAPSKLRARVPMASAKLPEELIEGRVRRGAMEDFLARQVRDAVRASGPLPRGPGSGKSGLIRIDAGDQAVIQRTALSISPDWVEARLEVGLPAAGRRVLGSMAEELLLQALPRVIRGALLWQSVPQPRARRFIECVENQEYIRSQLDTLGLVAFVGNGAILPRESGASDRPLPGAHAVPFRSPPSLELRIDLPNPVDHEPGASRQLSGMGIPRGVTLIVGGGYHGKSTLLRALERGVYPHVPGDGREYVVSSPKLVKIRAEDGRFVSQVDIQSFIGDLPGGRSTAAFCSDDASGSTSQAANIVEAIEAGARGLLLDEDTSATNFMVRDARMQALVHKRDEPITPFLDRVRELYDVQGVSTVLVMGGCGDYFDVADRVILMREYRPEDATAEAQRIAREISAGRSTEGRSSSSTGGERIPLAQSFDPTRGRRRIKIDAKSHDLLLYGSDAIDLRAVEQLLEASQTRAVGLAIHLASERFMDGHACLREILDQLDRLLDAEGLDVLDPFRRGEEHPGNLARPRRYEIAAAINRLRRLRVARAGPGTRNGVTVP